MSTAGTSVGHGIPELVMSLVPGRAVAVPDLHVLAAVAAVIHAVDASTFAHRCFPWYRGALTDAPPGATNRHHCRRAIEIWHTQMPAYRPGFLHRDFHPGNVLWQRDLAYV
jgi:Ser/Thr protein kinase RdoA (MazF antagonist)